MNPEADKVTRYNPLSGYLKKRYGQKVFKVTIDSHLTCPNRDGAIGYGGCSYCDPSTLVPEDFKGRTLSVDEQLRAGMERVRRRHGAERFIAYFQVNTNTHAPLDHLERIYREALVHKDVVGLAVSTRPDCAGERILDLLVEIKKQKDLWLELGLQSANDKTLERVNRGHGAAAFEDAVKRARDRSLEVCAHVIIGLPGEGREEILSTARFLSGLRPWGVKFHQLQVVKGTPLEEAYNIGELKVLGLEEYATLVVECLELMPPETLIHRLVGDTPERYLVAPRWGVNKFVVAETILKTMREKGTRQGAFFERTFPLRNPF